ncbi:MAG: protein phosphatase 2C domain-containing protein [Clostridia bacterium]|nr:protein phosphatase 2C domain-containing protein [Clostridia bacterium]
MATPNEGSPFILTDVENVDIIGTQKNGIHPSNDEIVEQSQELQENGALTTPDNSAAGTVQATEVSSAATGIAQPGTALTDAKHENDSEQKSEVKQPAAIQVVVEKKADADIPAIPTPVKALSNEEVTGHTAALWKYLPIPVDEPDPTPEYINGVVKFPGSLVIGARVRGKKHKHEGTNCDDWYEVANYEKITFVAVSDGAGSKKFSRIGAKESCKASIGYLVKTVEKLFTDKPEMRSSLSLELSDKKCMEACGILAGVVQQSVIKAYEAVEAAYYSRSVDPTYSAALGRSLQFKDLSGTLLITVLIPVSEFSKEYLVITCQIGDGMIALLNTEGEFTNSLKLMGVPDSGDFSGETDFLTSAQMKSLETLQNRTKISRCTIDTVFVMSDGVADDYFPNETEMRRLYFDLVVNDIVEGKEKRLTLGSLTPAQMRLFKRIPDPLSYPWVNDQKVQISLQYTKRICESTGLSLEDLWRDSTALSLAKLEVEDMDRIKDPSERLRIWLDNYVERGSFDDRTLVVVQL